ncbi:hypothetical protein BU25DRAFT_414189 [Macroventuria anomochaeta]|uniref:Uncharacterized protein n=1 Tax=Macroventuria anomochaeta TaxID=301207 RepID=A0ACB6RP95_9PLEO|nr:uncharacterized protein BU25DRAFT_414189 [Macroventuria anomochaeta]KAF2623726.1 hypothetical protein BU25DRAFT_414189 [Macroventuria anomochaeta]
MYNNTLTTMSTSTRFLDTVEQFMDRFKDLQDAHQASVSSLAQCRADYKAAKTHIMRFNVAIWLLDILLFIILVQTVSSNRETKTKHVCRRKLEDEEYEKIERED